MIGGAAVGGGGAQVWKDWGTSTHTMGLIDILKIIDILDILDKTIIQGTELLKTRMSTLSGLLAEGYQWSQRPQLIPGIHCHPPGFLFIAACAGDELRGAAEQAGSRQLPLTDCLGRIRSSQESFAISFPLEDVINSLPGC